MTRVLILGSSGVIGSVLMNGLAEHDNIELTPFDQTDGCDVFDRRQLAAAMTDQDVVVHLAWSVRTENSHQDNFDPQHPLMSHRVLNAAVDANVPRVVLASSVHADRFPGKAVAKKTLLSPYDPATPDSPYGASKLHMEALAKYYASAGVLQAICIRFGGVYPEGKEPPPHEVGVWLSHPDCVSLVRKCILAPEVPDNYVIMYGVSDNKWRVHDLTNPFKWVPDPLGGRQDR